MAGESENDLGIPGIGDAVLVGRGGFGAVYRADQSDFRRTVAVKVLTAPEADEVARARFARECQAMGSLSGHPHIVTLYDAGFLADGRAYLVMAYMEGGSLHEVAYGPDKLTWQEVATIGTKLAGALETAHRAGILHRDLKPANVLISTYGEPQLTDFGIARIAGGHETTSSHITASLPYAPPEILDGKAPSAASDVYGLAATLLHLVTGRAPFTHTDDTSFAPLLRRVYEEDIPDLTGYGVPAALDLVLRRAMSKDPAQRPVSAEELGRQIQAAQRSLGVPAGEMVIAGATRREPIVDDLPTTAPQSGQPGGGATAWWGATAPDASGGAPPAPPPPPVPTPPAGRPPAPPVATPPPPVYAPAPPPTAEAPAAAPAYVSQPQFATPPHGTGPVPAAGGGGRRTGLIVGGSVAAAVALVGGILAFSGGGGGGDDTGEAQTTTAEVTTEDSEDPTGSDEPSVTDEPTATATAETDTATAQQVPTPESPTPTPEAPPPTPAPAGDLTLGGSVSGSLTTGQIASHTFTGAALQVVEIVASSPNGDPFITLRDAAGNRIGLDDDCATQLATTDAQLVTTLPTDGLYTVEVEFIGGTGGDYTVTSSADVLPRRGTEQFTVIFGTPTAGRFQEAWVIATSDTSLTIEDATGRVVANDDDCFADLDPRIESFIGDPNAGIVVEAFAGVPTTTQIGLFGFDSFTAAGRIADSTTTAFVVDLTAGQTISALMTSSDGDSVLSVRDLDSNELAFDDDSGGGLDAQVSYTAAADGRYQVVASFLGVGTGAFEFAATIS